MNPLIAPLLRHWRARPLYWGCQLAFWGVFWITDLPEFDEAGRLSYPLDRFFFHGWECLSGILLTHAWRSWMRERNWHIASLNAVVWRLVLGSLVLAIVHQFISVWPRITPSASLPGHILVVLIVDFVLIDAVKIVGWTAIYFGFHSHEQLTSMRLRQSEIAAANRAAALASLRAQIHPHFLFNSLNTLRHLIDEDPKIARDTVTQLAKILRYSLQHSETSVVPLRDEVEAVQAYLDIEGTRFEQRLRVHTNIEPNTLEYSVPTLLLQTLAENAVKFGVNLSDEGTDIQIDARLQGSNLILIVSNKGHLVTSETTTGLGLFNARQRVSLLFGEAASMDLHEENGRVVAKVILPSAPMI